jgi:1-acyl-sn-glycerol-3-phosphate acyltransferase
VAWLADRLQVPVIPVAMWGVSAFNRPFDVYVRRHRPAITVRAGPPLRVQLPALERRKSLRAAADAVMLTIAGHLPTSMRGDYADGSEGWQSACLALKEGWVVPAGQRVQAFTLVTV